MIVESLVVLALLTAGSALVRTAGVRGWTLPTIGLPIGLAVHVLATALLGVAGLTAAAWLAPALTLGVGLGWYVRCSRGQDLSISPWLATLVVTATVGLVALFRASHLVNATPDSFRYLTTAGLLGAGRLDGASGFLLESRALTVPAMHAPATLNGELYLRSITPLLVLACAGCLAWLTRTGLRGRSAMPGAGLAAALAVALLVTNNRVWFHGFYINGHLVLAVWLLLVAGVAWLLLSGADLDDLVPSRLVGLLAVMAPAIVVTRPDAGVLTVLVVLPFVVAAAVPAAWRGALAASLGASMMVWQGYLLSAYGGLGAAPSSVPGLLAVGALVLAGAVAVVRADTTWLPRRSLGIVETLLWLGLFVAVVRDPGLLDASLRATLRNLSWDGGWGSSLWLLAALVLAVLLFTDTPGRATLRFPLTTFVPASLLLAYLREGAYRLGPGDSLNRMLLHYVPIAILLIVGSLASERWGRRVREPEKATATPGP